MKVAGVDLGGRKAAVSVFEEDQLLFTRDLTVAKAQRNEELKTLAFWVREQVEGCFFVCVEEAQVGRGVRASLQIAQTCGAVMAALYPIRAEWVPVSTWKKEVCGKGNMNKDMVREWLESSHPSYSRACGRNQDRIDATCIGLYGVQLLNRSRNLEEL